MRTAELSVIDLSANQEEPIVGCTYLVEERRPRQSLELCEKYAAEGANLMIISRDPPLKIMEGSSFSPKRTLWITSIVGKENLDPTAVGLLMNEIKKFIDQTGKKAVVLIDGLEYLISVNTYDRMLQFIHQMRDIFVMSGSILIIPIDTRTLSDREQALLERNLQVVVPVSASAEANGADGVLHISSGEGIGT